MLEVRSALRVFDKSVLSYPQAKYLRFSTRIAGGCASSDGFVGVGPSVPRCGLVFFCGLQYEIQSETMSTQLQYALERGNHLTVTPCLLH